MNRYRKKISNVLSARQLRMLYDRLDDEERFFRLRAAKKSRGIYLVTIVTHALSETYFKKLIKSLRRAW